MSRGAATVRPPLPADLSHPGRACRDDPDRLFPEDGERRESLIPRMEKTARELCEPCPILGACRDAGYQLKEVGLWGGVLHLKHGTSKEMKSIPLILGWRPTP